MSQIAHSLPSKITASVNTLSSLNYRPIHEAAITWHNIIYVFQGICSGRGVFFRPEKNTSSVYEIFYDTSVSNKILDFYWN